MLLKKLGDCFKYNKISSIKDELSLLVQKSQNIKSTVVLPVGKLTFPLSVSSSSIRLQFSYPISVYSLPKSS